MSFIQHKEKYYYIGLNSNNSICNELFFDGSITLYPTGEKGNIPYSREKLKDTKSDKFLEDYKEFIINNLNKILKNYSNVKCIIFNKKIRKLCKDIKDINIVELNKDETIDFLNDKFKVRDFLKDIVTIPESIKMKGSVITYENICNQLSGYKFVIQAPIGAGGENTYLVENKEDIQKCNLNENIIYNISSYVENTPLNITMMVGEKNIINFPISAQLIKITNNKFKYYGGDFNVVSTFPKKDIKKIFNLSYKICEKIKTIGYRGIIGIDYLYKMNGDIMFMEINPRFQSSSFLINIHLEKYYNTNIAEYHYNSTQGFILKEVKDLIINESFINCKINENFDNIKEDCKVLNGYFKDNEESVYRKICKRSIIIEDNFERIK